MSTDATVVRLPRTTLVRALAVGGLHALMAAGLFELFGFTYPRIASVLAYQVVGMVLLGAVPAVLLLQARLVTPALTVGALGAWGVYRTWRTQQLGLTPVDPTPFGWYLLLWAAILALALFVGGVEYGVRRYAIGRGVTGANSSPE